VMLALSVALIPRWGIAGAATGAAVTNAVANVWYLREVRRTLGLFPSGRGYLRLLLPLAGTLVVLLLLRAIPAGGHAEWPVIAAGLLLSYTAFIGIALAFPGAEANA
jgi:O-antigen/teichoic acid export membrane protein